MPDEQKDPADSNPASSDAVLQRPNDDDVVPEKAVELSAIEARAESESVLPGAEANEQLMPSPLPLAASQPFAEDKPKKSRKALLIALIVILILAVGGGSWAAYALWYQNPEKVLLDGFTNAYKAKSSVLTGNVNFESEDTKLALTFGSNQDKNSGTSGSAKATFTDKDGNKFTFEGETLTDKESTVYFRVKNLKAGYDKMVDSYVQKQIEEYGSDGSMEMTPAEEAQLKQEVKKFYDGLINPIITKIDNRWIKVSVADLKEINAESGKEYECTQNVMKKAMNNHKIAGQVVDVYKKNKFVIFKENLGIKAGSIGYVIDIDDEKAKQFGEGVKKLDIYKEFEGCTKKSDKSSSGSGKNDDKVDQPSTSQTTQRMEIWVDQWSHEVTSLKATATNTEDKKTQKFDMNIATKFNVPVTIDVPKDTMTLKELSAELQQIFSTFSGSSQSSASGSSETQLF